MEYDVSLSNNKGIYPEYRQDVCNGICRVVRLSAERINFEFSVKSESSYHPQKWIGFYASSVGWSGWVKQSTAEPPQEYSLPLAEGLVQSSASWYSMDQFNQVHVHGAISAGSGSLEWDTLVATLPEGYRPGAKIEAPATFASGGKNGSGAVAVSADGTIKVFPDISSTQKVVYFDLFFLHV